MIIREEMKWREGDSQRKNGYKDKRRHLLVQCDKCGNQKWMVKYSFIKSRTYYKNNEDFRDYCRRCRWDRDKELEIFYKKTRQDISSQIPKLFKKKKIRHSSGYIRVWITDLNHPRLNKNKRHKNPKGGRVYEHILIMEKHLGRYLKLEEMVHHINGVKTDNRIKNLYLCRDSSHHKKIHNKMQEFIFNGIKNGSIVFDKELEEFKCG